MILITQEHIDILEASVREAHDLLEEARSYYPGTLGLGRLLEVEAKVKLLEDALEAAKGLRMAQCN